MSVHDFEVSTIDGQTRSLGDYRDQVLLIVNVASKCGFTPQYEGLEKLYRQYRDRGFAVLGFPCNQFGKQEPGTEDEIRQFCSTTYNVSFPMFAKVEVNGGNAHPLYRYLKAEQGGKLGSRIKWNFTKFLVDGQGAVRKRYAPSAKPEKIGEELEQWLAN